MVESVINISLLFKVGCINKIHIFFFLLKINVEDAFLKCNLYAGAYDNLYVLNLITHYENKQL